MALSGFVLYRTTYVRVGISSISPTTQNQGWAKSLLHPPTHFSHFAELSLSDRLNSALTNDVHTRRIYPVCSMCSHTYTELRVVLKSSFANPGRKKGENLLNVTTGAEPSVAVVHHIILESVFLFCLFVFIVVVVNLMESV